MGTSLNLLNFVGIKVFHGDLLLDKHRGVVLDEAHEEDCEGQNTQTTYQTGKNLVDQEPSGDAPAHLEVDGHSQSFGDYQINDGQSHAGARHVAEPRKYHDEGRPKKQACLNDDQSRSA